MHRIGVVFWVVSSQILQLIYVFFLTVLAEVQHLYKTTSKIFVFKFLVFCRDY